MTKKLPDARQIQYLPLADLQADPRNPKSHALDVIDSSIDRFGYVEPIVRDERTGYIISGHGRSQALKEMEERGETPPEGLKVIDGVWHAPVVTGWASRSDTEAAAALIALNRTTELGGWVDDALLELLEELEDSDPEHAFNGVGFTEDDLLALEEKVEAARQGASFDSAVEGLDMGRSTFNDSGGWGNDLDTEVELKFLVSPEERSAVLKWLNSVKESSGVDTLGEALVHLAAEAGFQNEQV